MLAGKHWALDKVRKQWDGKWRLLSYNVPEHVRHLRDRLRQELRCLGYGSLGGSLWISPYDHHRELMKFFNTIRAKEYVEAFEAHYAGPHANQELAQKAWDIHGLEKRYQKFVEEYSKVLSACKNAIRKRVKIDPKECFALRFRVTAEFINIALDEPMLPLELLPDHWIGLRAKEIYLEVWKILTPEADKFVDSVFKEGKEHKQRGDEDE